jgi:hypothetical protein
MTSINPTIKGGVSVIPLKIFQPFNSIVYFSIYSPIILASSITGMSFVFQNFKGLIYLLFLIGCCFVRSYMYSINGASPIVSDGTICTSVQYSKYGNASFSVFVFAFTIMYLSLPMFTNGTPNFCIFSSLLVYFIIDILIKIYKRCLVKMGDLILNIFTGLASAALIVTLMYTGGSSKYLFFNEIVSNKEVCYKPSNQTFKCAVYKNGELVGDI